MGVGRRRQPFAGRAAVEQQFEIREAPADIAQGSAAPRAVEARPDLRVLPGMEVP
jgi:hypothetical protein